MSPSAAIVSRATEVRVVVDDMGRRIAIRGLTALDKLHIFKAAGPDLALNQPWLAMAILASSVTAIDDVPVPSPSTELQIESLVGRLGDSGIDAIALALDPLTTSLEAEQVTTAGNLFGTPS
jgi:hypothetical protein